MCYFLSEHVAKGLTKTLTLEKDVFFCLVMSVGQRKILIPHEELNLRPSDFRALML